jgi:NIMA (never in mitosis gene a)-related kinase 2
MTQKERDQLHAEFSILASLKHANIVGYYHREHLKQTQELYLYMEYCGGGDLGSIIKDLKKKREYPKEEFVWRILSQLVTAATTASTLRSRGQILRARRTHGPRART